MGRPTHTRALSVWANGQRVGLWSIPARGDTEFQYDRAWLDSPGGRPLSLSLPFGVDDAPLTGERVRNYFDNLLPDSEPIRRRIATRFRTPSLDAFDLLRAIGRDCIGAVQLLDEDDTPDAIERIEGTALSDGEIEALLQQTIAPAPFGDGDDLRISLAGAQEKTALLRHDGRWLKPHGTTPTTHILKLPLGLVGNKRADWTTSVENEWLCLELLRAFGLPAARSEILTFGSQKVLCVERFDRRLHSGGGWIMRLPQEDFCQVFGKPSHLKYEADGGPGVPDIASVLRQSAQPERDLGILLSAQILFLLLAAPDGHAKNFSIHLLPRGRFVLTPLYDVMSIWPVEGDGGNQWSWHKARLAMAVSGKNRHYVMKEIGRRHFNAMAHRCFLGAEAEPLIGQLLGRLQYAIDDVAARLPPHFPARVAERIFAGLRASAARLAAEAEVL
ncbi:type II toxin-antitoxin system HipA family toxin [Paraburkholderia phosphatilytica]|uniref:type II toxin-antitoxin system HipA family toxin n=1 Tax=Paraburkholderia phosphatilytica TaxID=2282883 RepID=UPI000E4BF9A8|nr:type II toxin-antitoxin system HipA family toxin [Paraburkholderia phosphatilytica]